MTIVIRPRRGAPDEANRYSKKVTRRSEWITDTNEKRDLQRSLDQLYMTNLIIWIEHGTFSDPKAIQQYLWQQNVKMKRMVSFEAASGVQWQRGRLQSIRGYGPREFFDAKTEFAGTYKPRYLGSRIHIFKMVRAHSIECTCAVEVSYVPTDKSATGSKTWTSFMLGRILCQRKKPVVDSKPLCSTWKIYSMILYLGVCR